jgi:hypothetical protein
MSNTGKIKKGIKQKWFSKVTCDVRNKFISSTDWAEGFCDHQNLKAGVESYRNFILALRIL